MSKIWYGFAAQDHAKVQFLNKAVIMKDFLQKILPRKNQFTGVDIGTNWIKVVEVRISGGMAEIVSLKKYPSPPGVWTEQFDEEHLVEVLSRVRTEGIHEVIACIGGEKVISRVVRFPLMSDKELAAAAEIEIEKYLTSPSDQFIFRHVRLDEGKTGDGDVEEGQNVLLLAVPASTVYRYYGIFSRAGLTVTAFDIQVFALWRLFGRNTTGTLAVIDIGSMTSHLVITRNGRIRFVRVLPVGGSVLTRAIMDTQGVGASEAQQMQEDASLLRDNAGSLSGGRQLVEILRGSLMEIAGEVQRSLNFYSVQEGAPVERLILSGGTSKLKGLPLFMQDVLGIPVGIGTVDLPLPGGEGFDPAYAIALGLAMRGIY